MCPIVHVSGKFAVETRQLSPLNLCCKKPASSLELTIQIPRGLLPMEAYLFFLSKGVGFGHWQLVKRLQPPGHLGAHDISFLALWESGSPPYANSGSAGRAH